MEGGKRPTMKRRMRVARRGEWTYLCGSLVKVQDDGPRGDLDNHLHIARELRAGTVLDVGCGTGSFALRLASLEVVVTGVDPAAASLNVARAKQGARQVTWLHGDATTLPPMRIDLAVMTGNVAQVFLTDAAWHDTLTRLRHALAPGGHLVFETRNLEYRSWEKWASDPAIESIDIDGVGLVTQRRDVTDIALPYVSFRHAYTLPDGTEITSDSTLRFRDPDEIAVSFDAARYTLIDRRDAPDRPGAEHVYIAQRNSASRTSLEYFRPHEPAPRAPVCAAASGH